MCPRIVAAPDDRTAHYITNLYSSGVVVFSYIPFDVEMK
jgi:hypothetical protein